MLHRRHLLSLLPATLAATALNTRAQTRLRQATLLVGSPAGGATDKLGRYLAEQLTGRYADTVIVENRPGAGSSIAFTYMKTAGKTDGSLVVITPAYPIVVSPHVSSTLQYDPLKDFVPVASCGRSGMAISVGPGAPASVKTLADFVAWCKANPRLALYGAQNGSSQHLMGLRFALASGAPLSNVSYKGGAPIVQDLLGGHIPAAFNPISEIVAHHKAGRIRTLATTTPQRSKFLPDVPTMFESGVDVRAQDWLGLFAPAGTDAAAVAALNAEMTRLMSSDAGIAALAGMGFEPETSTPAQFATQVRADHARYATIVDQTGFKKAAQE